MRSHGEHKDENLLDELGYEPRDIQLSQTAKPLIWFGIFSVISMIAAWGYMSVVDRDSIRSKTDADIARSNMPPKDTPLIQGNIMVVKDIQDLRAEEYEKSHSSGWVDQGKGVAKIPVKNAMDIVIARGLPTAAGAKIPEDYGK